MLTSSLTPASPSLPRRPPHLRLELVLAAGEKALLPRLPALRLCQLRRRPQVASQVRQPAGRAARPGRPGQQAPWLHAAGEGGSAGAAGAARPSAAALGSGGRFEAGPLRVVAHWGRALQASYAAAQPPDGGARQLACCQERMKAYAQSLGPPFKFFASALAHVCSSPVLW